MSKDVFGKGFGILIVLIIGLALSSNAFAQGNSKGKAKAKGKADKVSKGKGNSNKNKSENVVDDILGTGKGKKNNNPGTSKRFNGLAKKIGMSPESARAWYETERALNPDLTYGQFVAANMIARKHGSRNSLLTTERILTGLRNGGNLGQSVKNLGFRDKDYKKERKRIDKIFKKSAKKNKNKKNKDPFDYRIGT